MSKIGNAFRSFEETVKFSEIKLNARVLLTLTFVLAALGVTLALMYDITLGFLLTVLFLDLGIGLPYFFAERKVAQLEARLPDVLHHMSTTLKTGGTVEVALREVSRLNYGPITKSLKVVLRQMNEGKPFEEAFNDFARSSRSELLQRAAVIIIAARKAGGGLLDTLTAMAEDIRALMRLQQERRTKTFMQFLFIMVAGCLVAPFVFGILKSVLQILLQAGGVAATQTVVVSFYDTLFKAYIIIEASLTTLGAVLVREGKWSKAILYIPLGMIAAYVVYVFIAGIFLGMLGASI